MLYLREDNVEAFFTLLGTELYTFGLIYLSENVGQQIVPYEINCEWVSFQW